MDSRFIDRLFELGKTKGFTAQEVYYISNRNIEISVYEGALDKYNLSEDAGLSYRGMLEGKLGYAYSEILDEEAMHMLVEEAYANAKIIESEDEVFLHDGTGHYETYEQTSGNAADVSMPQKIQFMLDLENRIMGFDERVKNISRNSYNESESYRRIKNTLGLDVEDRQKYCFAYAMPVVSDGHDKRSGLGYDISNTFEKLSLDKIVNESLAEPLKMLGAKTIKSYKGPVIFKNVVFGELFSEYMGLFSADRVHKNLSGLKGKLNDLIASEIFTLIDDPLLEAGLASSSFDAEGVATFKKPIIEKGILKTYFHNLKTAKKDGTLSTGNASKASYKGTVGIAPSNLMIEPGIDTLEDLIKRVDYGMFITGVQGLHSGVDSISGDFSLQCHGFLIESGKITRPVSQITVAGNYFEMLKDIQGLADDVRFSLLATDYIGSPSVKVGALSISGE